MDEESDVVKAPGLIKRLTLTGQLTRFIVYLSAAIPAFIFIFFALLSFLEIINPIYISSGDGFIVIGTPVDFLLIAVLIFTGVYGIYEFLRLRRVRKIDDRFPDFVRDLAESRHAGMTFTTLLKTTTSVSFEPAIARKRE